MTREPVPLDETPIETTPPLVSTGMREPTADFINTVTIAIKGGASPYVASEWAGVPRKRFQRWMRTHDDLRTAVRQALAHVKVRLQSELAKRSPEKALRHLHVRDAQAEAGRTSSEPRPYTVGSGHTIVAKALPFLVERVNDATIPASDLSPVEQAARAWRDDVLSDLGGVTNISAARMALVNAALGSLIILASVDRYLFALAGADGLTSRKHRRLFPVVEQRMRIADSLARQVQALGLDRAKTTPTDLNAYITEKYGHAEQQQEGSP